MIKVLVVIAPKRYREEEYEETAKALDRAGIKYDVASTIKGTCEGMMGGTQESSLLISDAKEENYDGIVIIGGLGASDFLWKEEPLVELVKQFDEKKKVVAAICLAPVVLARAGILKGKQATVFETPASRELLRQGGANFVKVHVVSDMNIITADHPISASEFAEAVLDKLGC
ncbi:protease I [Methanomicrobium sp. W14]|jgi:protease I|uniref:DJ-1/PfpI family protein n=1 Tax=Methanomicrobium sp. W14 TaxID=2817839 RepID=UPI001FD92008|nr:DJ-1/PfpI family protein [Methanomicrobium sp. W14]MBP2134559.1 protease I [Methanomicrobium sp. W14]